ncbi:isochorismatase family protein [Candidatus Latescibacterota bacterium]
MHLPLHYYRIGNLYGPGMPPTGPPGPHEKLLERQIGQLGLVLVHCWNLGESDGPYPISSADHRPGEAADWVPAAHGIIRQRIAPVLTAARQSGMAVFHLAQQGYVHRYPQYARIAADPALQPLTQPVEGGTQVEGCLQPRSREEKWSDQYGPEFPGPVWVTHAETFDIATPLKPLPTEDVFLDGWQLNGLCRRRGIDTLIYAGFMADLCLLNVPGALREMSSHFGYRCVVLGDCTIAYEYEDTHRGQWMTRAAIRLVETDLGYSCSADELVAALPASPGVEG